MRAVDVLLQTDRPLLDRAAAVPPPGRSRRLRKLLARATTAVRPGWFEEQLLFEARLRDAVAELARAHAAEQSSRERTDEAVRTLAESSRQVDELLRELIDALTHRVSMLEIRLRAEAIERSRNAAGGGAEGAAAGAVPPLTDFDYLGFENRFRGPEELVRERQRQHADRLEGIGEVADLGCGRGEFLEILRERGVDAVGVDSSGQMVALAQEKGLRAEHGDMFAFLAAREPGSLGGILCSHVVEHLWPADHMRLARLCASALRPGGLLIVETPNPKSLVAGAVNFSCDPTHLRPVFPETLAFMLEDAGFDEVEIVYLSPVPDERRARPVTDAPPGLAGLVEQVNEAVQRLDDLVFGDQEYAIVARRAG